MPIVRQYGVGLLSKLAQKVGINKTAAEEAELQNQIELNRQRMAYEQANLQAKLRSDFEQALMQEQTKMAIAQQDQLYQQARDRMARDWELEKLQMRSVNDFQLQERRHQLQMEYYMQKELQQLAERDAKIRQLDKDLADGRISRAEYDKFLNLIQYNVRPQKTNELDEMLMQMLSPQQAAGTKTTAPDIQQAATEVAAEPEPKVEPPYTRNWWGKKIPNDKGLNIALEDLAMVLTNPDDRAAVVYARMHFTPEEKLKLYETYLKKVTKNG